MNQPRSPARYMLLPLLVATAVGVGFSFSPMLWLVLRLIGEIFALVWTVCMVGRAVKAAWWANWARCVSIAAVLIAVWPIAYTLALRAGDYIHLAIMWPSYRGRIEVAQGSRVYFDRGDCTAHSWMGHSAVLFTIARTENAPQLDVPFSPQDVEGTRHRHLIGYFCVIEQNA